MEIPSVMHLAMVQGSTEYLAQCGTDDLQMRAINAYGAGALSR